MGSITTLLGGARSGKSALAVELGRRHEAGGGQVVVVATAEPFDDDLARRIERHRADRPPWTTVEAPVELAAAIGVLPPESMIILDCVTVWLANLFHHRPHGDPLREAQAVVTALGDRPGASVVISNEVGLGIVPADAGTRAYRDALGTINQRLVNASQRALLLIAGRAVALVDVEDLLR